MESHARSDAVIELGKRLVTQLEFGDDLLAQWMAHDLAARICEVERAGTDARVVQRDDCTRSILALWEHRHSFPRQLRPFREIEPLMRTLESLDLENDDHFRYHDPSSIYGAPEDADPGGKQWLKFALGLDYAAREMIRYLLRLAAEDAASRAQPWVKAADQGDLNALPERAVIRFLLGKDTSKAVDIEESPEKVMSNRIAKLESFVELASLVITDLRAQLGPDIYSEIDPEASRSDKER